MAHPAWPLLEEVLSLTLEEARNLPRPGAVRDYPEVCAYHRGMCDSLDTVYTRLAQLRDKVERVVVAEEKRIANQA